MPNEPWVPRRRTSAAPPPRSDAADPIFFLRLSNDSAVPVIQARGDLDMSTAHLLTELVDYVVAAAAPPLLVIDLADLRFLSAQGITALLHARATMLARHGHLILREPLALAHQILTITELMDQFHVQGDIRLALSG